MSQKICILGEGITAKAVAGKVKGDSRFTVVPLEQAELVIVNPGLPPRDYPKTKAEIISEIEFTYRYFLKDNTIIAITGTNGKSTTTALIAHCLAVEPVGNIGKPFIDADFSKKYLVAEVSTYQLYSSTTFRPHIAVLTNITPDHLDWHESFENYVEAKFKIAGQQIEKDYFVYNPNDKLTISRLPNIKAKKIPFDLALLQKMQGRNNENFAAAYAVLKICGLTEKEIEKKFKSFKSLPHRLEKVENTWGIEIYNDSKATNPESTIFALKQFNKNLILLLGGRDKNTSLQEMKKEMQGKIKKLIIFGEAKGRFAKEFKDFPQQIIKNLKEAVDLAKKEKAKGDILLLSPACSSFDQFKNFEERGEVFKKLIYESK